MSTQSITTIRVNNSEKFSKFKLELESQLTHRFQAILKSPTINIDDDKLLITFDTFQCIVQYIFQLIQSYQYEENNVICINYVVDVNHSNQYYVLKSVKTDNGFELTDCTNVIRLDTVESLLYNVPESNQYILKLNVDQANKFIKESNLLWKSKPEYLRKGQMLFNLLHQQYPKLADMVKGTENDPFYNDNLLSNFFNFIQQ